MFPARGKAIPGAPSNLPAIRLTPYHQNPLHPPRLIRASFRRTLALSATDPITISPDRQSITLRLHDGSTVTQRITPTPKVKLEKLAQGLSSVLSAPDSRPPTTSNLSFGTAQWELDPGGDAIHRHISLSSPSECDRVEQLLMAEAEAVNHHPHIARGENSGDSSSSTRMTITCTTHSPRGLSARDMRLAARINEVLKDFEVMRPVELPTSGQGLEQDQHRQILSLREGLIAVNRQSISRALESCQCATPEKS